jgi:hypothetical protein
MGMRTIIGLLTRRAAKLGRMVNSDLSSMSRHGPTERRHFIGVAVCAPISVAWDTLGDPLTRFNESAQHWIRMATELTHSPPYISSLLKIVQPYASSLLNAGRTKVRESAVRARSRYARIY